MLTSGRDDVKRWILGYGAEAKVLEPRDLREEIIEEIARLEKNYQS
jgi:predicted DNA-binding transcriptional regulator YafY